jgi:hypothetical protein
MKRIELMGLLLIPVLGLSAPADAGEEAIFTKDNPRSLTFKWVEDGTGTQTVSQLWPNEDAAKNDHGADVIAWAWDKGPDQEQQWSGWGVQWKGWNKPISFYDLVGQPDHLRDPGGSLQAAQEFKRLANAYELSFYVKCSVPDQQQQSVVVKFDGRGDIPSVSIPFLEYIVDDSGQPAQLSASQFRKVRIPLNDFDIVRSRIDGNAIKHIVFGAPSMAGAKGELYLYGLRVSDN